MKILKSILSQKPLNLFEENFLSTEKRNIASVYRSVKDFIEKNQSDLSKYKIIATFPVRVAAPRINFSNVNLSDNDYDVGFDVMNKKIMFYISHSLGDHIKMDGLYAPKQESYFLSLIHECAEGTYLSKIPVAELGRKSGLESHDFAKKIVIKSLDILIYQTNADFFIEKRNQLLRSY
ncbi:MAG: hypothetical protein PHG05_02065 [Candidatus Nanoarchaeia archaeon]|nr:hypothetical protein [Candidatus Nanoarchaeia archaeon]